MDSLAFTALGLLAGFTLLGLLATKVFRKRLCPICFAASATWILGLGAYFASAPLIHSTVIAILAGASLGAVAERYGSKFGFVWKTIWTISGTFGLFFLTERNLKSATLFIFINLVFTVVSRYWKPKSASGEDMFKDCC